MGSQVTHGNKSIDIYQMAGCVEDHGSWKSNLSGNKSIDFCQMEGCVESHGSWMNNGCLSL